MRNKIKTLLLALVLSVNAEAGVLFSEDFESYTIGTWPTATWIETYQFTGPCGAAFYDVQSAGAPFGTGQAAKYNDGSNSWSHVYNFSESIPADFEMSADFSCTDCWMTLRVQNADGSQSYWIRGRDVTNVVQVVVNPSGVTSNCPISGSPKWGPSGGATIVNLSHTFASPFNMKAKVSGSTITVYINDVQVAEVSDSTYLTAGDFGVGMIGGGWIDNVLITKLFPLVTNASIDTGTTKAVSSSYKVTQ